MQQVDNFNGHVMLNIQQIHEEDKSFYNFLLLFFIISKYIFKG